MLSQKGPQNKPYLCRRRPILAIKAESKNIHKKEKEKKKNQQQQHAKSI